MHGSGPEAQDCKLKHGCDGFIRILSLACHGHHLASQRLLNFSSIRSWKKAKLFASIPLETSGEFSIKTR
jgi:hypothetical protein